MILDYKKDITTKTIILNFFKKILTNKFAEFILINLFSKTSFYTKIIPQEYLYPKKSPRYYDKNGIKLNLNISNVIDHGIYFGIQDSGFENLIKLIKPHFHIFDIGANIGTTAVKFAKLSSKGKVYAFEPSSLNFKRLTEHISMNNIDNLVCENFAFGDRYGTLKLYSVDENNPGMNMILDHAESDLIFENIKITTVDSYVSSKNIESIDLIKIDVEGFEFNVLKGALESISRFRPIIFMEVIDIYLKNNGSSAQEILTFFEKLNYKVFKSYNMTELNSQSNTDNVQFDIICLPN